MENFPLNTTETVLKKLFSKFGTIKRIDLPTFNPEHPICRGLPKPKVKGYAFIEFSSRDEANKATTFFNDLTFIQFNKQNIPNADSQLKGDDHELRIEIWQNLEFNELLNVRVMPKQTFQDLSDRYNDQKFKSLVRAAKLLAIM